MKRFVTKNLGIERLITTLNNSKISVSNNPLYQTIYNLINNLNDVNETTGARITAIEDAATAPPSPGSSIVPSNTVATLDGTNDPGVSVEYSRGDHKHDFDTSIFSDFVTMSDGGIPNAQPLNNGAGQFIYTPYVP